MIVLSRMIYPQTDYCKSLIYLFTVTFIDFAAAFDSVSHKYIDTALAAAGASTKCRKIFRAIYAAATGVVRVNGSNGKRIYSAAFNIGRGVIQGDIISPILFILALDQLVRTHDVHGTGYNCGHYLNVRLLGYADDMTMLEPEVDDMTIRLTALADGAKQDADMQVKMAKTFSQHVAKRSKAKLDKAVAAQVQKQYKHECEYCGRRFKLKKSVAIHQRSCVHSYCATEEYFVVEDIIGVFGHISNRWYLVRWEGYEEPEWERSRQLEADGCHEVIRSFWEKSGLSPCKEMYTDPNGKHRCEVCARCFKRSQDLKAHRTRTKHYTSRNTTITSTAKKDALTIQMKAQQAALPKVKWGDKEAENCWHFPYLGAIFESGGGQIADVHRRIMLATVRFGQMRHVWKAKALHLRLRMRLYIASVCSILTYGSEDWCLDSDICRMINGANSRMVSVITGRTPHEEAKEGSKSFDLLRAIRARRLTWLGHILRMDDDRLLAKAVRHKYDTRSEGDILSDAPKTESWAELKAWAQDKKKWRMRVYGVRLGNRTSVSLQALFVPEQEFTFTVST